MTIVFARNQYSLDSFLKKGCKNVFHEKKSCKRIEGRSFDGRVDLGEGKESKKKRKKSRRREGVESVGIPLKVVVKVVRLVPEEKTTRFGQRGTTHRSGNGGRRGRFVDVEGKVSRYVNRIKVDVENMLGSQTEPYTPSTYFIQFRCGIFISYFHGPASIQLRRSFQPRKATLVRFSFYVAQFARLKLYIIRMGIIGAASLKILLLNFRNFNNEGCYI